MAFVFANRGLFTLLNSAISGTTDLRQAVFTDAGTPPTTAAIRDMNFLSELKAVYTEAVVAGYSRADLASVTLTENDTPDNVTLTAAAPVYTAVAAGEIWEAVAYFVEGGSDAARVLIGVDTPAAPVTTNGGNITGPALSVTVTGS